jgi:hypothetical protein
VVAVNRGFTRYSFGGNEMNKKLLVKDQWEIHMIHPVSKTKVGRNPKKNEEVSAKELWEVSETDMGNPFMIDQDSNVLLMENGKMYISRKLADRLGSEPQHLHPNLKVGRMGFFNFTELFDDLVKYNSHPSRNIHEKLVRERNQNVIDWVLDRLYPSESPPVDYLMWRADMWNGSHPQEKTTPDRVKVLVQGEKYWLGAVWGKFDSETDSFDLGNCSVPVNYTVFRGTER